MKNKINLKEDNKQYDFIKKIKQENVQLFVIDTINKYGTEDKLIEANKVCDVMYQILDKKHLIFEEADPRFLDSMISSAMLHNLFFDLSNPISIFEARNKLEKNANKKYKIGIGITDAIFQTIEGQLGENSFIPTCRPSPGSPTDIFATAVWFVKKYNANY